MVTTMNKVLDNPFKITTPEDLTAEETAKLFVNVFTDFHQITTPGNVLIKGPRGVGKSMMLRYLEPDCQCLENKVPLSDLSFIAIYVPLKNTNFSLAELKKFDNKHASVVLNEHIMIVHCLSKVFENLKETDILDDTHTNKLKEFYQNEFLDYFDVKNAECLDNLNSKDMFDLMHKHIESLYRKVMRYIKKDAFSNRIEPYSGELFDYNNYLVPILQRLSEAITNNLATFYLLLDDAHFLSAIQTQILNTWISSRTSRKVSLKVSTQYNYKLYYTTNGATIDTPHDYLEVDIATIYTEGNKSNKSTYYKRIEDIVKKRLELFDIDSSVQDFFPSDKEQDDAINKIYNSYIERYERGEGRGTNRSDDARRYSRPDFIKSLAGTSKSSYTYSYAGFDQLVNISSGVVRYFLQYAHSMYATQQANMKAGKKISFIPPSIQNQIVVDEAHKALFNELKAYQKEGHEIAYPCDDIEKLFNLLNGLGGFFRKILLSDRSERRVFSVAISDKPSEEVLRILDIGLQLGYLHRSTIGRKNSGSIGRTYLYVLNRRLAPNWILDPNGFAGYLFLKNSRLEDMINDPIGAIERYDPSIRGTKDNPDQLTFFDSALETEDNEILSEGDSK